MDIIEKTINNWGEDICNRFTGHRICLYYDRNNFQAYFGMVFDTKQKIVGILECLLKSETEVQLHLRVHFYRKWTIVRITGDKRIPQDAEYKIKNLCYGCLLTVVDQDNSYIIKLVF